MSNFSSSTQQLYGIWSHIHENTPIPEREEIASFVGRHLLHSNQSLWQEKHALQDIVYELRGFVPVTPGTSSSSRSNSRPASSAGGGRLAGKRLFHDAIKYSKVHYSDELGFGNEQLLQQYRDNEEISGILIKTDFSIETIQSDLDIIRMILNEENKRLEEIIMLLQRKMEEDPDEIDALYTSTTQSMNQLKLHTTSDDTSFNNDNQRRKSSTTSVASSNNQKNNTAAENEKLQLAKTFQQKRSNNNHHNNNSQLLQSMSQLSLQEINSHSGLTTVSSTRSSEDFTQSMSMSSLPTVATTALTSPYGKKQSTNKLRDRLKDAQMELYLVDDL